MNADLLLLGPGSFAGSTLAALMTGDLVRAVVATRARRVLVNNLAREPHASYGIEQHERILRDHIVIKSGGDSALIDAMSHTPLGHRADDRSDGSVAYASCVARPGEHTHDETLLAAALSQHFGLLSIGSRPTPEVDANALALFEEALTAATGRLGQVSATVSSR